MVKLALSNKGSTCLSKPKVNCVILIVDIKNPPPVPPWNKKILPIFRKGVGV
jgi:hypothetical protein